MKKLSKLISVLLMLSMLFSLFCITSYAADGCISGECSVSVCKNGTTKYTYKLLTAEGGSEVADAVWSVTAEEEGDISTYAVISEAGVLSLTSAAAGKTLTVAASGGDYSASIVVTVADTAVDSEIAGASEILRAPEGTYASHKFTLSSDVENVKWSISDWKDFYSADVAVPDGVFMLEDGSLIVSGSAADAANSAVDIKNDNLENATFNVVAKTEGGEIIATKQVKYINEIKTWTDLPARNFDDMEGQTEGAMPNGVGSIGANTYVDRPFSYWRAQDTTGTLTVKAEADGNKYIQAAGRANQWSTSSTLLVELSGDTGKLKEQPVITLESDFKPETSVLGSNEYSLWFVCVTSGGNSADTGGLDLRYKKESVGVIGIYSHMNPDKSGVGRYNDNSTGTKLAEVKADEWFNARAEITTAKDGKLGSFDLYINDTLVLEDEPTVLEGVNWLRVGCSIDNLALYSESKVTNAYTVSGDDTLIPPASGIVSKHTYSAAKAIDWYEYSGAVKFALKTETAGVSISDDGVLELDGSAVKSGSFIVQAKAENGTVLGEKTVTIPTTLYAWLKDSRGEALNLNYIYADFENQTVGEAPNNRPYSGVNYDSNIVNFYAGLNSAAAPVIAEENGNKYVKASGQFNGTYSSGSALAMEFKDDAKNIIKNNSVVTLEASFKAEKELFNEEGLTEAELNYKGVRNYSLLFICDGHKDGNDKGRLDIRYSVLDSDHNKIGIYSNMNADGTGMKNGYQKGDLLYVVNADEWFNARVEIKRDANGGTGKFDLYINDCLVLKDEPTAFTTTNNVFTGACIDNIAIYSGSKKVQTASADNDILVYADGTKLTAENGRYALADGSTTAVVSIAAQDSVLAGNDGKQLIAAVYNADGALIRSTYSDLVTSRAGITSGALSVSAAGGSYVKAFIWGTDGSLKPIR